MTLFTLCQPEILAGFPLTYGAQGKQSGAALIQLLQDLNLCPIKMNSVKEWLSAVPKL